MTNATVILVELGEHLWAGGRSVSLAKRLRAFRDQAGLSLDQLADRAKMSKGYIWELEQDEEGKKKPSAEILMRLANALSVTLADLLALPTVRVKKDKLPLNRALREFKDRMETLGTPLEENDLRELAGMSFRGGQPRTADEWHTLYLTLDRITKRKKDGEKAD
jgi:transcriptional regulator with XRE-family HTH domain